MRKTLLFALIAASACSPAAAPCEPATCFGYCDASGICQALPPVDSGVVDSGVPLTCPALSHDDGDGGCSTVIDWSDAPTGPASRDHHVTFLMPRDGGATLFVSGGVDEVAGIARKDLWSADVGTDGSVQGWKSNPSGPIFQAGHTVTVVGQRAYLISGKSNSGTSIVMSPKVTSVEQNAETGALTWREELPLPAARFHAASALIDRWLFVVGGLENQPELAKPSVYRAEVPADGTLGAWQAVTDLPKGRSHHATFVKGNRLYALGGVDGSGIGFPSMDFADYSFAEVSSTGELGAWTTDSLPFTKSTASAVVLGEHVYLFGGFDGSVSSPSDRVRRGRFLADGKLGEWQELTPLPFARAHVHQTPVWRDFIFSACGNGGGHVPVNRVVVGRIH